ncbi:MAG: hypothetical protein NTX15_07320, partial [Candidatus Kapabacteria bacterium]|nr:hypothetical protein [Candidatus Kapabacteria bacterium]
MDLGYFPHPFVTTIGRIVDVHEASQVVVIKDSSNSVLTYPLPTASLGLSTWLSTSPDLIGREVGIVTSVGTTSRPWLVIEPQMIIDVTEAAQLVTSSGIVADQVLTKRMRPPGAMSLALTGSLVNTAFDILAQRPSLSDDEIIVDSLKTRPLSLAAAVQEGTFDKVLETLRSSLPALRMMYETFRTGVITLEPHYISPMFGLQGRADICVRAENVVHVIEMKAGKAASGNTVRPDHSSQTAGYATLVRATNPTMD